MGGPFSWRVLVGSGMRGWEARGLRRMGKYKISTINVSVSPHNDAPGEGAYPAPIMLNGWDGKEIKSIDWMDGWTMKWREQEGRFK